MPKPIELNLNLNEILQYFGECYVKFKQTNQICSTLKLANQSTLNGIRDRSKKDIYSCFYESKKFPGCLM